MKKAFIFGLAMAITSSVFAGTGQIGSVGKSEALARKAISASKALYSLNGMKAGKVKFVVEDVKCDGEMESQSCEMNIAVQAEEPIAGGLSYKATFVNENLSSVEQVCLYCW